MTWRFHIDSWFMDLPGGRSLRVTGNWWAVRAAPARRGTMEVLDWGRGGKTDAECAASRLGLLNLDSRGRISDMDKPSTKYLVDVSEVGEIGFASKPIDELVTLVTPDGDYDLTLQEARMLHRLLSSALVEVG